VARVLPSTGAFAATTPRSVPDAETPLDWEYKWAASSLGRHVARITTRETSETTQSKRSSNVSVASKSDVIKKRRGSQQARDNVTIAGKSDVRARRRCLSGLSGT
jgi:hypothetical protein